MSALDPAKMVIIGRIGRPFGVHGWVNIRTYTDPVDNIFSYDPWYIHCQGQWQKVTNLEGKLHGKGVIAFWQALDNREIAQEYTGCNIAITREQLPELVEDCFYWADLEGLNVFNRDGSVLGKVEYVFNSGASDILAVKGERDYWIPYIKHQTILKVDLKQQRMDVDWDPNI